MRCFKLTYTGCGLYKIRSDGGTIIKHITTFRHNNYIHSFVLMTKSRIFVYQNHSIFSNTTFVLSLFELLVLKWLKTILENLFPTLMFITIQIHIFYCKNIFKESFLIQFKNDCWWFWVIKWLHFIHSFDDVLAPFYVTTR